MSVVLALAIAAVSSPRAFALIFGGVGNKPLHDPGWPAGAAAVFNTEFRIAYWEGPPLGGGQWHAECRGDAKALSAVLADFAKVDLKNKSIVLHNGIGRSFWLSNQPAKRAAAAMDWMFMVWQPQSWQQQRRLPADISSVKSSDADSGPPAQIDVYTGGNVKWEDVIVPKGLTIIDQRLEAHGFKPADGVVLEGKITDAVTNQPLAARVRLERVDRPEGGTVVAMQGDAKGHWLLKKLPEGSFRVVVLAQGYVPRVIGYTTVDEQPRWQGFDCALARPGPVSGRVTDDAGKPLADVDVRIGDVVAEPGGHYETPAGTRTTTDKDGRFRVDDVPIGKASVWVYTTGYVRPGLGPNFTTPKKDLELTMVRAARIEIHVDFTGKERPGGYIVNMAPEGGSKVGKWSGSGNINANNRLTWDHIPPGRYVLTGRPNPGSDNQQTAPVTVDLKGGETTKVTLNAK